MSIPPVEWQPRPVPISEQIARILGLSVPFPHVNIGAFADNISGGHVNELRGGRCVLVLPEDHHLAIHANGRTAFIDKFGRVSLVGGVELGQFVAKGQIYLTDEGKELIGAAGAYLQSRAGGIYRR